MKLEENSYLDGYFLARQVMPGENNLAKLALTECFYKLVLADTSQSIVRVRWRWRSGCCLCGLFCSCWCCRRGWWSCYCWRCPFVSNPGWSGRWRMRLGGRRHIRFARPLPFCAKLIRDMSNRHCWKGNWCKICFCCYGCKGRKRQSNQQQLPSSSSAT